MKLRRRAGRAFARSIAALLVSAAAAAVAQPVAPPAGTAAPEPVAAPPVPSPFAPDLPEQAASPRPTADTSTSIAAVRVDAGASGAEALPPPEWTPPVDPSGAIVLRHRAGQPLDAAWVREQFDGKTAAGPISASTAVGIVQLINRAFVTAGFVNSGLLVTGPLAADGVLDLRLVYGRLATSGANETPIVVEWGDKSARGLSADYIRARFPSANGQPLSALDLERDFRLLDESPAIRSISAALRPGAEPGEATLHLVVHPADRWDFYTGASNDRSPSVGSDHLFAGASGRNLVTSGDLLTVEGGITRGVHDGQFGYSLPFYWVPLSLNLRGSFNNAAVITSALAPLDIRARDRSAEAGLSYEVMRTPMMVRGARQRWSPSESLSAGLSFVWRRQNSFLLGEPFSFAPGSVDGRAEYRALRLSGDYVRRNLDRVIAVSVGVTRGFDGTRSDVPGIPNPPPHFMALLGQVNVAQRLGRGFELRGRLTGQTANGPLYSGLRLAVGGANSVRGYRESLFLVDRGVIGSLELAHALNLGGERRREGFNWSLFSASVFADGAVFGNVDTAQPAKRRIGSVGVALAWTPSSALRASVSYGHGLTHVDTPGQRTLQDRGISFRIIVHPARIF